MNSIISVEALTKKFRNCTALEDVSFSIDTPCIVGLIGNNGAGKTTLLKLLSGNYTPTNGVANVLDNNALDIISRENCIFIDDTVSYPFHFSLKDILKEMPDNFKNWDAKKADMLMQHYDLPFDRNYSKLSKGMKSTFNTIVALSANVPITLLDEPTSGMDVGARNDFYKIVLNEFIANPRLIIISSHLIGEMENILSEAIILKASKLIFSGDVNELTRKGYRLQGNKADISPLLADAQIFEETSVFGKIQYALMREYTESDFEYMTQHGIERQQLSLNDICVYLCNATRGDLRDIYK